MLLTFLAVLWLLLSTAAIVVVAVLPGRRFGVRERVLVNLLDGKALDGVLWKRTSAFLVLKDVTLLVPDAQPARVPGEVLVERDRVDFVQVGG